MSQNPYSQLGEGSGGQFPYGPDLVPANPGRTSILAIIALVVSVCGCVCPVLVVPGALAMVLGGIAVLLIALSNWRERGVGIAITAICLGLFQTVVVALLFFGIYQPVMGGWRSVVVGPVGQVLTDIDKGDIAAARAGLTPHAQTLITEDMLVDFATRYHAQTGKFQSFPSNPLDIYETYKGIAPSFKALDNGSGQPNADNLIPLPGRFEKGDALVIMQLDQGQMPKHRTRGWNVSPAPAGPVTTTTTTTPAAAPAPNSNGQFQMPVLNIGIATNDGKVEWLIDPDVARKAGHPQGPPPGAPSGGPPPGKPHRSGTKPGAAAPTAPTEPGSPPPPPPDDKP